jgi:hypothetical protein
MFFALNMNLFIFYSLSVVLLMCGMPVLKLHVLSYVEALKRQWLDGGVAGVNMECYMCALLLFCGVYGN